MSSRMQLYLGVLLLLNTHFLSAQRVLYSPFIDSRYLVRFEVAGKAGDYYWIHKEKKNKSIKRHEEPSLNNEQSFEVYDTRMNLANILPSFIISDSTIKEYLIPGYRYFDQLVLTSGY